MHDNISDIVTPLHRSCRKGLDEDVKKLIEAGSDPFARAKNSITPLHVAAAFGHQKCTKILLDSIQKPPIAYPCDDQKHTPLHYACNEGHLSIVKELTSSDIISVADIVNAKNASLNRPLHFAATSGKPELCEYLLSKGADINAQNKYGQTALHFATLYQCVPTVTLLLNQKIAKVNPNIRDGKGNTCSHVALKNGQIEIIQLFSKHKDTDFSIQDNDLNTVIHIALRTGHFNLIKSLLLPKANDLTKKDADGCSVIFDAIRNQEEELALAMLSACPMLAQSTNNDLVTPLHLAAERGMKGLTQKLLIDGAKVDAVDINGLTPSLYCAKNDAVLDCLAMIEDIMITDCNIENGNNASNGHQLK